MSKKYKPNYNRAIKLHLLRESNKCALCGEEFTNMKEVSIDHIVPTSKGGCNSRTNMQLAHISCNGKKGDSLAGVVGNET